MVPPRFQLGLLLVLLLLLCSVGSWHWVRPELASSNRTVAIHATNAEQISAEALQKIHSHLDRASARTQQLLDRGFPTLDRLFGDAHAQVMPFAKDCLGWSSKWNLVLDAMPFSEGGRHEAFLKQSFEKRIFSSSQLERAIEQTIREHLVEIRNIESEMLVALRADITDLPALESISTLSREELELQFQRALVDAANVVGDDLSTNIQSQLVSLIAGEVLAQVAVRLGVSAGILTTGAASGWATFGVGLIAGLIVDQIVARIWDWWSDPDAELGLQLAGKLVELQELICNGDETVLGLRGEFQRLAESRDRARREAIDGILNSALAQSGNRASEPNPTDAQARSSAYHKK